MKHKMRLTQGFPGHKDAKSGLRRVIFRFDVPELPLIFPSFLDQRVANIAQPRLV